MTTSTPEPTPPLTDDELTVLRRSIETTDLFDPASLPLAFEDRKRLLATVDRLKSDVMWLLGELGDDHWRECDDTDCYICDGYQAIGERWESATTPPAGETHG